jgi:hypothetical protein
MRNNSGAILKWTAIAFAFMAIAMTSCATNHSCTGLCVNKGKPAGKFYGMAKNSKPSSW